MKQSIETQMEELNHVVMEKSEFRHWAKSKLKNIYSFRTNLRKKCFERNVKFDRHFSHFKQKKFRTLGRTFGSAVKTVSRMFTGLFSVEKLKQLDKFFRLWAEN